MPSFSLETPVWVQPCSPGWGSWWMATSVTGSHLLRLVRLVARLIRGFVHRLIVGVVGVVVVRVVGTMARVGISRRLQPEPVDPEEEHERADRGEPQVEDDAVADERQTGGD